MITLPNIDPVIVQIGPLAIRWYGMMYLLGFLVGFYLLRRFAPRRGFTLNDDQLADLVFYLLGGVVLGGRLGYCLFYNTAFYLANPLKIAYVWEGGMSFHGGLLGVVVAAILYARRQSISSLALGDLLVVASTPGLGFGRLGNFINSELWGRTTDVPWGMVFPGAGPDPRHPSQLYEAILEGPVLFVLLYLVLRCSRINGLALFLFFAGYGLFRFVVEFFRQPDAHLGFLWGGATMGQLLSLPMMIVGVGGALWLYRKG